jgi:hypothetical protein
MNLPDPEETLAGCCWLPRILAKARAYTRGSLPHSYRMAFGSRIGVDGYFCRHFNISRAELLAAVNATAVDEKLAKWFLAQPLITPASVAEWNDLAPKLGSKGYPGYCTLHLVKWMLYPKSISIPTRSIFAAIQRDESRKPSL